MKKHAFAFAMVLAGAANVAGAQAPKFEYGKADDVKDVKATQWTAQAEAGAILTTGNTENMTATAAVKGARKTSSNKLEFTAAVAFIESGVRKDPIDEDNNGTISSNEIKTDRIKTAETYEGKLRYDQFLGKKQSLFAALLGRRDVPAGKDAVIGGQFGYSRVLWAGDTSEAVAELGYDFSYEKIKGADDALNIHSARAFVGTKGKISDDTTWNASLEALGNVNSFTVSTRADKVGLFEDLRLNLVSGITTKLGKKLSAAFTFEAKYDDVPAPLSVSNVPAGTVLDPTLEAANLDTLFKASLIYSFM